MCRLSGNLRGLKVLHPTGLYRDSLLDAFPKLRKMTISFVMSVCPSVLPHGITLLRLDGFSWNMIFEASSRICRENPSFFKIGQAPRVLYMKTNTHSLSISLNSSYNEKSRRKDQSTHFMFNFFFPRKSCNLWDKVEKCRRAGQATDDNIQRHMRNSCWIPKATETPSE